MTSKLKYHKDYTELGQTYQLVVKRHIEPNSNIILKLLIFLGLHQIVSMKSSNSYSEITFMLSKKRPFPVS